MIRTKAFATFGLVAMIAAAACSGERTPLAPQGTQVPAAVPSLDRVSVDEPAIGEGTTLVRGTPLGADVTVSRSIGPAGGELAIPEAGLRLFVPRGALSRTTTITATALKGDLVAYEFGPHGTRFALPLIVTQATAGTDADDLPAGTVLHLGYFSGRQALDPVGKKARIAELISRLAFVADDAVVFPVWHFSGYTVLYGFKGNGRGSDEANDQEGER